MNGLPSFRFAPYFEADAARHPGASPRERFTIGDRLHPNPFGASIAAAALLQEIRLRRTEFRPDEAFADPEVVAAARGRGRGDPSEARRLVNLANTLLGEDRTDEAIAAYRRAIDEQPDLAEAHHNLGVALRSSGHLREALDEFQTAAELAPEIADLHFGVGVTLARLDRPAEAAEAFRRALALKPDHAAAARELASVEAAAGS